MSASIPVKDFVRDYWNHRSHTFDEQPNHHWQTLQQKRSWLELLSSLVGAETTDALDLGCGTGFLSLLLAELGHRVTGVDIAPEMIALATQKSADLGLTVDWRVGDVETLPDAADTYGFVTGSHLIWSLPNPIDALAEWHRVLRPGGRIALFEFGGHWGTEPRRGQPEYQPYRDALPYFGGTPGETITTAMTAVGFINTEMRSSESDELWGGAMSVHRYIAIGEKAR